MKIKTYTYAVYRQNPPVFVGKDGCGNDQFRTDLENIGTVSGSYNECWIQAEKMCALPVMEKLSEESRNVH